MKIRFLHTWFDKGGVSSVSIPSHLFSIKCEICQYHKYNYVLDRSVGQSSDPLITKAVELHPYGNFFHHTAMCWHWALDSASALWLNHVYLSAYWEKSEQLSHSAPAEAEKGVLGRYREAAPSACGAVYSGMPYCTRQLGRRKTGQTSCADIDRRSHLHTNKVLNQLQANIHVPA